jgi:hypothetical protein
MLSENGLHESAVRAAINTEEPSIGHWWKQWNATTCYEAFPNSPVKTGGTLNHVRMRYLSTAPCCCTVLLVLLLRAAGAAECCCRRS